MTGVELVKKKQTTNDFSLMALQQVTSENWRSPINKKGHEPCDLVANSWPVHPMEVVAQDLVLRPHPNRRVASKTDTNCNGFDKCLYLSHIAYLPPFGLVIHL